MAKSVQFENFDPEEEDFESYCDRMDQYFVITDIKEEKAKTATLISMIGAKSYSLLKDLSAPVKPKDMQFDEICNKLKGYYSPEKPTLANRFNFY